MATIPTSCCGVTRSGIVTLSAEEARMDGAIGELYILKGFKRFHNMAVAIVTIWKEGQADCLQRKGIHYRLWPIRTSIEL